MVKTVPDYEVGIPSTVLNEGVLFFTHSNRLVFAAGPIVGGVS